MAAAGSALAGFGQMAVTLGNAVIFRRYVPDAFRGRVVGVANSIPTAAMILSSALAGAAGTAVSPRLVFTFAAVPVLLAAVIAFVSIRESSVPKDHNQPPSSPTTAS